MDRLLSRVGLSGKAFVPLLSGFACAIPAIMATRTMDSARDRLRTIFVLPFMSCSARLPVYALLVGAFFATAPAWHRGGIVLGLYVLGVVAAFATSWAWMTRSNQAATSTFILELPTYKTPQLKAVVRAMLTNTWAFISRAGTIIFALSVILWAMTYWPRLDESRVVVDPSADEALVETTLAAEQLRHSFAGRLGHLIEPVIEPMGFDWKMGVGLVGAFAAREVFVSTMGIVYAAGDAEEDSTPLVDAMLADRYADGSMVWTPLVAVTMLIWFVLAMQCMSTVAIVKRETGGWRWPIIQLVYMNGLAWVLCVAVYQIGRAMGY
jgi:ferrous iron transport protein B